jgi:hypothetical protein
MKKFRLLLIAAILIPFVASSQQNFSYSVDRIPFKNPVNNFDTTYAWYCHISLPDTTSVAKIHCKMGTNHGGGQLVEHAFNFDQVTFLPAGLSYRRDSATIQIGLGNHKLRNYYLEVRLEDDSNFVSAPVFWNNL